MAGLLEVGVEAADNRAGVGGVEATVDGEPVPFTLGDHTLTVDTSPRREPVTVAVSYSATPRHGMHFRVPGRDSPDTYLEAWTQGEKTDHQHWFPLVDDPGDRFTYSGRFTAPPGLKVLSNGQSARDGDAWTYALEQDLVSYLPMVAVADYDVHVDDSGPVPLEAWVPPGTPAGVLAASWATTGQTLTWLAELTGTPFPYDRYDTVYVQRFLWGGMENTTATVLNQSHLIDPSRVETRHHAPYVVAHEAAHQWFGDYVTCRTWSELWLNEGLTTFFADEVMGRHFGPEHRALWLARRFDGARASGPLAGRWWSTPDGDHEPHGNVYVKGASVAQMLRAQVGQPAFDAAIARYLADNAHGLVTTADLRRAFEAETGDHLGWFFDQWVHLGPPPAVDVGWRWADGALTVTARQDGEPLRLPLDVHVAGATHRLWLDEAGGRWTLPVDQRPSFVAVDPEAAVLSELRVDQDDSAWRAQALDGPTPYSRLRALMALGEADSTTDTVDLLTGIASNAAAADALRETAIAALSHHAPGRGALVALLEDPGDRIRLAAAEALGAGGPHPEAADALATVARSDANVDVRCAAHRALAHHDPDSAVRLARERLLLRGRPLDQAVSVELLGRHGELEDLGELKRLLRPRTAHGPRHAAGTAAVRLIAQVESPGERRRLQSALARDLEPMLEDRDIRTRHHGLGLLAEVGDDTTVAVLEDFRRSETVVRLQERAARTATAIRERADEPPPTPAESAGKLADLEARLAALEARLAEVEQHQ